MANLVSLPLVAALAAPPTPPPAADPAPAEGARPFVGATEPGVPPTVLVPEVAVDAEALYQQGEQAYWLGDFNQAVEKFEAAYAASHLPALLYNVGLAYLRRFEISADPKDLQRAGAVLRNYNIELEKDPSLGQADNVPKLLAQIDELLARARDAAAARSAPAVERQITCPEPPPAAPLAAAPPPGRRTGAAIMGVGALVLAGGVSTALAFAFKGRQFREQLAGLRADRQAAGCTDMTSPTCSYLDAATQVTLENGRRANLLGGALGGGLAALGLAGLAVGAVLHGRARPSAGARAGLRVGPTLGGLVLHGSF